MSRIPSRNPPAPTGEIALTTYDVSVWEAARMYAEEWHVDLGLYVEYSLRSYHKKRHDKLRFARWKHEQDMKDPDNRAIRDFLAENDPRPEPEYMEPKYAPKSARKLPRRVAR